MAENFHYYFDEEIVEKMKPQSRHVILELRDDRKMHNGIYLVKMSALIPDRGLVVKVANDLEEKEIVPGSKVIFDKYMGKKIFSNEKTYLLLHEEHITCLLSDDADVGIKYDAKL